MEDDRTVTVYHFRVYEGAGELPRVIGFKTTRDRIEADYLGEVIEGTAETIDVADLDEDGCYHRVATGWGTLDAA